MAVRQYIGARYVPKFSEHNNGVWDNTYTYEALEIVKHGNDYYTARKAVPTGVAITNTEYWVLTGNYNGAISDLDDRVTDNTNDISALEKRSSIYTYTPDDNIILLGDSWSVGVEADHGIAYYLPMYIQHNNWYNGIVGSASFYNTPPKNYKYQLQQVEATIADDNDIQHIILQGDVNDQGSDHESYIADFLDYARSTFPNATIEFFAVNRGIFKAIGNHTYIWDMLKQTKDPYIRCFDLTHNLPINGWTSEYHCGEANYKLVAKMMADLLKGGVPNCGYSKITTTGETSGGWSISDITERCINGSLSITIPSSSKTNVAVASGAAKTLDFECVDDLHGTSDFRTLIYLRLQRTSTSDEYVIPAICYLTDSKTIHLLWTDDASITTYFSAAITNSMLNIGYNY